MSPDDARLRLMFPCKPEREQRHQPGPAGRTLAVRTLSCKAEGQQFSFTWVDVGSPSEVPPALRRLHEGPARMLVEGREAAVAIPGMTADPLARQWQWSAPEGQPRQQVRQALFASGPRVYQLLQQGEREHPEAWDIFVGSVVLDPG